MPSFDSRAIRAAPRHPWLVDPARPSLGNRSVGSTRLPISSKTHPPSPSPGDGESEARLRLAYRDLGGDALASAATFPVTIYYSIGTAPAHIHLAYPLGGSSVEPLRGV
jgi:hypothetical protein